MLQSSSTFVITLISDPSKWGDMEEPCISTTLAQIGCEIRASLEYFRFGVHFSKDDINRPGFTKFFLDSASEEREHSIKLIEYLTMRGAAQPATTSQSTETSKSSASKSDISGFLSNAATCNIFSIDNRCFKSGYSALECALSMETNVTDHIYKVIRNCEGTDNCDAKECQNKQVAKDSTKLEKSSFFNDYHFVDYLTGEFLEEQYKGQREIAGRMKTLEKLTSTHGSIGEFLFDKQLLD